MKYIILIIVLVIGLVSMRKEESSVLHDLSKKVGDTNSQLQLTESQNKLIHQIIVEDFLGWAYDQNSVYGEMLINAYVQITAQKLFEDYNANEIKADNFYRNKNLVVTGTISSIDRGLSDSYFLSLATKDRFSTVQANFDEQYKDTLAELHKGSVYVIHCIGDGMLIRTPILKKCKPIADWASDEANKLLSKFPQVLKDLANKTKNYSDSEKKGIFYIALCTSLIKSLPDDSILFDVSKVDFTYPINKATSDKINLESKKISQEQLIQNLQNIFIELGIDNNDLLDDLKVLLNKDKSRE